MINEYKRRAVLSLAAVIALGIAVAIARPLVMQPDAGVGPVPGALSAGPAKVGISDSTTLKCGAGAPGVPYLGAGPVEVAETICEAVRNCVAQCAVGLTPKQCGYRRTAPMMTALDCRFLERAPIAAVQIERRRKVAESAFSGEVFFGDLDGERMVFGVTLFDGEVQIYGWGRSLPGGESSECQNVASERASLLKL